MTVQLHRTLIAALAVLLIFAASLPAALAQNVAADVQPAAEELSDTQFMDLIMRGVLESANDDTILRSIVKRGNTDAIAALILMMRFGSERKTIDEAISALAGEPIKGWQEAMIWQERHPEVKPHPGYRLMKLRLFEDVDPQFLRFLGEERSLPQNMRIRLEEIEWGGVAVDGIPSLDNPKLIESGEAQYLGDDNLVFGVSINGDSRAYPLRIMGWHEMFNEVIGGVPVALAYCTLCGAGILYETQVEGRAKPFVFGSSGFLYRSNKLMFDRETDSLWNQFSGEPVVGPLAGSGIRLKVRPVTITRWKDWRALHPDTKLLALDTGFRRDYGEGVVYRDYFSSKELMFPAAVNDESVVTKKDYVFGIRETGAQKAWPLAAFRDEPVINDSVGEHAVVLIGDAETRTVRAYERGDRQFSPGPDPMTLIGPGGEWKSGEDFLTGPQGEKLPRVAGHIAYWFGWENYFGVTSQLYKPKQR